MSFVIEGDGLDRARKMLAGIPKGADKAIANALNKSARTALNGVIKGVKANYLINSPKARRYGTYILRAKPGALSATVGFKGSVLALSYFKYSPKNPARATPFAQVKKSGGGSFRRNAFVAKMPTGHIGIFERYGGKFMAGKGPRGKIRGKGRTKGVKAIREFYGPSFSYMAKNPEIHVGITLSVQETFAVNLNQQISNMLGKYA